jgi:hypothetical protein
VKMGPIRRPETSVNNYHTTPRNIPEERRSQLWYRRIKERNNLGKLGVDKVMLKWIVKNISYFKIVSRLSVSQYSRAMDFLFGIQ